MLVHVRTHTPCELLAAAAVAQEAAAVLHEHTHAAGELGALSVLVVPIR
jgi:hypothetical protein